MKYLENNNNVLWVKHPSAENSRFRSLADKYFSKGAGSILSFGFKGDDEQLDRFFKHLKYFSYHVNIGDVRSLIVNSPKTTHAEMDPEHLRRADIEENTVRISAGIESAKDLIADLDNAFHFVFDSEEIEITSADITDLDEIAKLESICFSPKKAASKKAFEYRLSNYPQWFLAAKKDGRIVGLIDGTSSDKAYITDDVYRVGGEYDDNGKTLLIFGLEVHPDYRGSGIARKLINNILKKASENGKTRVSLTCVEKLIPFYENFGFKNHGISKSVLGDEPNYDMVIDLYNK